MKKQNGWYVMFKRGGWYICLLINGVGKKIEKIGSIRFKMKIIDYFFRARFLADHYNRRDGYPEKYDS
ncbi:MAG: hypothetical protein WC451_03365 [Patescibacteria group bacterium]